MRLNDVYKGAMDRKKTEESKAEGERKPGRKRRVLRWLLVASGVAVALLVVFILSIPFIVTHIPLPDLDLDVSPYLEGDTAKLFDSRRITAEFDVKRGNPDGFRVRARGRLLDWPFRASSNVGFGFDGAKGDFTFVMEDAGFRLRSDFEVYSSTHWNFSATVPETRLSQDNAVLAQIISRLDAATASNLVFSGTLSLEAEGASTPERPVPSWKANVSLKDAGFALDAAGRRLEASGIRLRAGASGIADHIDIAPLFPRADSVAYAGFALTNVFASVRATERSYLVTEAGAGCCGGELKLYSLFLDPERLTAGATVFIDGVDAGEALSHVSGFSGEATGRLHGKLPFFLKDGKTLSFKNAYLFSTPGESGTLRLREATPILDNLAYGGVSAATRDNLANALSDMEYNVLKVELKRGAEGEDSALAVKLEGTATRGALTVPVNLGCTFHGDLDRLLKTGMNISRRYK